MLDRRSTRVGAPVPRRRRRSAPTADARNCHRDPPTSRRQEGRLVRRSAPAPATPARSHPRATSRQQRWSARSRQPCRDPPRARGAGERLRAGRKRGSAARPLANVSATRDGDVGPGSRNTPCVLHTWYALRSRIALGRSDIETIGMVYSSRSGRAPRGALGGAAVWRVAADM
jgi:hypothetical protein